MAAKPMPQVRHGKQRRRPQSDQITHWPVVCVQNKNPSAPGMKWETMLTFVRKKAHKPESVVRGPTTHQLWRFAAHVKGLSREFGVCYSCGGSMERGGNLCPHCNRLQEPPIHPIALEAGARRRHAYFGNFRSPTRAADPSHSGELPPDLRENSGQADELMKEKRDRRTRRNDSAETGARQGSRGPRTRSGPARPGNRCPRGGQVDREKKAIERDRLAWPATAKAAGERELRGASEARPTPKRPPPPSPKPPFSEINPSPAGVRPFGPVLRESHRRRKTINRRPQFQGAAHRDGGFLSAKDLAAAFKFNHQNGRCRPRTQGPGG